MCSAALTMDHCTIQGGIRFFMGNFESSLQDFDIDVELKRGKTSTLQQRSLVHCIPGKFSEPLKDDVVTAMEINSALNDINDMVVVLKQIKNSPLPIQVSALDHPGSSHSEQTLHQDDLLQIM